MRDHDLDNVVGLGVHRWANRNRHCGYPRGREVIPVLVVPQLLAGCARFAVAVPLTDPPLPRWLQAPQPKTHRYRLEDYLDAARQIRKQQGALREYQARDSGRQAAEAGSRDRILGAATGQGPASEAE